MSDKTPERRVLNLAEEDKYIPLAVYEETRDGHTSSFEWHLLIAQPVNGIYNRHINALNEPLPREGYVNGICDLGVDKLDHACNKINEYAARICRLMRSLRTPESPFIMTLIYRGKL